MASIDLGSGRSGKKALDASIPLVPFIDLLLCCVMFLLVTAVWNELASIDAAQIGPGTAADRLMEDTRKLQVLVNAQGFVITTGAGDSVELPRVGEQLDIGALTARLDTYRRAHPNDAAITISPDDGIPYQAVIATMDAVRASGFSAIQL